MSSSGRLGLCRLVVHKLIGKPPPPNTHIKFLNSFNLSTDWYVVGEGLNLQLFVQGWGCNPGVPCLLDIVQGPEFGSITAKFTNDLFNQSQCT